MKTSFRNYFYQILISSWLENRATLTFAVELTAHATKFVLYLLFFFSVYSFYGVPLNIIREIYSSFIKLRQRLLAFSSYHRLTWSMNKHFSSITTEEELNSAGRTCIICRDRMEVTGTYGGCKELPSCRHVFHQHCLRQWLVQQQTCPTCRTEILSKSDSLIEKTQEQDGINNMEALALSQNGHSSHEKKSQKLKSENLLGNIVENKSSIIIIKTNKQTKKSIMSISESNEDKLGDVCYLRLPCVFRVIAKCGADVIDINKSRSTPEFHRKKIRTIPLGKLVVVTDLRRVPKCSKILSDSKEKELIFYRIPDGWIFGNDLHVVLMLGLK